MYAPNGRLGALGSLAALGAFSFPITRVCEVLGGEGFGGGAQGADASVAAVNRRAEHIARRQAPSRA